jgi:hypothetical protein
MLEYVTEPVVLLLPALCPKRLRLLCPLFTLDPV